MIGVQFIKIDERAIPPRNAYGDDAGWDLFSIEDVEIGPYEIKDVRTGIAIALPVGYYARIVARSSTWRKRGLGVAEGIIDAGFRGELFTGAYLLQHLALDRNRQPYETYHKVKAGESIAQLIVQEVRPVEFVEMDELPSSPRGEKGFGSSGNC